MFRPQLSQSGCTPFLGIFPTTQVKIQVARYDEIGAQKTLDCLLTVSIRELQREKVWSRLHLVPLLLAEGDRDEYRRQQAANAREREIMKDVKGWEVSLQRWEGSGCELTAFCRLANQFTMTPDMRPSTKLLFCRK